MGAATIFYGIRMASEYRPEQVKRISDALPEGWNVLVSEGAEFAKVFAALEESVIQTNPGTSAPVPTVFPIREAEAIQARKALAEAGFTVKLRNFLWQFTTVS